MVFVCIIDWRNLVARFGKNIFATWESAKEGQANTNYQQGTISLSMKQKI